MHYDKDGSKVGETRFTEDWLGSQRQEHYDADGNKSGESRKGSDWLGNERAEHFNNSGERTGWSKDDTNWLGEPIQRHFDASREEVGSTTREMDWFGQTRKVHTGHNPKTVSGIHAKSDATKHKEAISGSSTVSAVKHSGYSLSIGFIFFIVFIISILFAWLSGSQESAKSSNVVKQIEQPLIDSPPKVTHVKTPQQLCMQSWLITNTHWLKEMVCEDKKLMELNKINLAMHQERIKVEGESRRKKIELDRMNLETFMELCSINRNQNKRDCVEQQLHENIEQLSSLIGYRLP